jgi:hypothetical protein
MTGMDVIVTNSFIDVLLALPSSVDGFDMTIPGEAYAHQQPRTSNTYFVHVGVPFFSLSSHSAISVEIS